MAEFEISKLKFEIEVTMSDEKKEQWKETQLGWDDTEFLSKKANALMKKRWLRLNRMISKATAEEAVRMNGYVNFLDIGAGRGDFYRYVEDSVKKYTGIEPSEKMLEFDIIEEDFELKRGSGEEFTSEPVYDVCLIKEALDHCYDPGKVVENAYKALKDGGVVIVTLTNRDSYYKKLFAKKAAALEKEHTDHLFNFNMRQAEELVAKAGFEVTRAFTYNFLRLPNFLEQALGSMPAPFVFWVLDLTDALFRPFMKKSGGSFIVIGRKGRPQ
jgi:SAM-dependent methyltransferase